VLISDGEDTGGPDAVTAAELAATAGVHIETIGVGTVDGTTIEVDGYQVATALNETAAHRRRAGRQRPVPPRGRRRVAQLGLQDAQPENHHQGRVRRAHRGSSRFALLLLTVGGLLMINWFGRIL
jgi:Ca-activated chloride channel family protein